MICFITIKKLACDTVTRVVPNRKFFIQHKAHDKTVCGLIIYLDHELGNSTKNKI